jgi:proline racemase
MMLKTIDAHVGGQAVRLAVAGFPSPLGKTMTAKLRWLEQREDERRRVLMLEPRGHLDLAGALFTESSVPGVHAGLVFMNHAGFTAVPGSTVMAAAAIGLSRGLVMPGGDGASAAFDTPAGIVRATVGAGDGSVAVIGPPAFVFTPGLTIRMGRRSVQTDIAYSGGFFALVDGEAAGVGTDQSYAAVLRDAAIEIAQTINESVDVVHPVDDTLRGIAGVIFTATPNDASSDLRAVVVSSAGMIDRSAGGCAVGAVLAVLDAMNLLEDGRDFRVEGLMNTSMSARVAQRTAVGEIPAMLAQVSGTAWVTGEHSFTVDAGDALGSGIEVSASRFRPTAGIRE